MIGPRADIFYGDGNYPGDGGPALERWWRSLPWREIRNCPGRYTTRDAAARDESPGTVLARCGLATAACRACHEVQCTGKDPMRLQRLIGGGGLLTYCRRDGVFIHTLNTESGL